MDILDRLRICGEIWRGADVDLMKDAADEIARLRAELEFARVDAERLLGNLIAVRAALEYENGKAITDTLWMIPFDYSGTMFDYIDAAIDAAGVWEMTDANEALRALILEAMRAGYEAGHHWTVEGGYSEEWADDHVDEWIEDCDLVQPLRAHLTYPGYVRVPDSWKSAAENAIRFVDSDMVTAYPIAAAEHIKGLANLLLAAAQETSHD